MMSVKSTGLCKTLNNVSCSKEVTMTHTKTHVWEVRFQVDR